MTSAVIKLHTISRSQAMHVLWVMGSPDGMQPGGFIEKLIEAAIVADQNNLALLEQGFEGLVNAVRAWKTLPNGVDILRKIARGENWE